VEEMASEESKTELAVEEPRLIKTSSIELGPTSSSSIFFNQSAAEIDEATIFNVESPTTRSSVDIGKFIIRIENKQVQHLATILSMQEMFLKTVMNLLDIQNIENFERMVEPESRNVYFERKRKHKSSPLSVTL
jgi:hypothetical protein